MKPLWATALVIATAAASAFGGSVLDIDFEEMAAGAAPVNQFVENRGAIKLDGYVAKNPLAIASAATQFGTRKVAQFTGNEVIPLSLNKAYSTMTGVSLNRPRTATAATSTTGLGLAGDLTFECYFKVETNQVGTSGYLFYNQYFSVLLNASGSLTISFQDSAAHAKSFTIGAIPVWTAGSPGSWTSGYTYQPVAGNKRIFILPKPSDTPVSPVNFLTGADSMYNRNTRAGDPTMVSYVCDGKWHHLAVTVNRTETVPGQLPTTGSFPPVGRFRVFWDGYDLTLYDELVNTNTKSAAATKPQHAYRLNQWTKDTTKWGDNGSSSWTMGTVGNPAADCFIGAQTATGTSPFKGMIDQIIISDEVLSPRSFRIPKVLPVVLPLTPTVQWTKNYLAVKIGSTKNLTVSGTQPLGLVASFDGGQNATMSYLSAWGYEPSATLGSQQGTIKMDAASVNFGLLYGTMYGLRSNVDTWQFAPIIGTSVNASNFVSTAVSGYLKGTLANAVFGFQPWYASVTTGNSASTPPGNGTFYKVEAAQGLSDIVVNGTITCGAPTIVEGPGEDPRVVKYLLAFDMPLSYNMGTSGSVDGNVNATGTLTRTRYPSAVVNAAPSALATTSFTANGQVQGGTLRQTECYVAVDTADKGTTAASLWAIVQGVGQADTNSTPQSFAGSITGLAAGMTYHHRFFTITPEGHQTWATSAQTAASTGTQAAPPACVAWASTDRTASSFTANWAANMAATAYFVDVATDSGFGVGTFVPGWENAAVGNVFTIPGPSGLTVGGAYYYRVRAQNAAGTGPNSNVITVFPPAAPVAGSPTAIATTSFSANWAAALGATNYYLDVATESGFTTYATGWSNKLVANVTTYSVTTGLTAGNTYYYRLRAENGAGTSPNSGVIPVTLKPLAPTASAATDRTASSFSANWGSCAGATNYRLDVATANTFAVGTFVPSYQDIAVGNTTTFSVNSGLSGSGTYYYRVRAENAGGVGANSGTITVALPPAAPVASAATALTGSSFSANWGASSGATAYFLDVATDSGFTSFVSGWQNKSVNNVTTYSVNSGLGVTGVFHYRVRAQNGAGTSADSETITVSLPPDAPVAGAATLPMTSSFSANWAASAGAAAYSLDVATDSGFTSFVSGWQNKSVGDVTTYSVNSGLSAGGTYYYRVRAQNPGGTSGDSGAIDVTLPPDAPVAGAATLPTTSSFSANWAASFGATAYFLDVAKDIGFTDYVIGWQNKSVGDVTTYSVNSGLSIGGTYFFRIRAQNAAGTSANSDTITVNLVVAPTAPVAGVAAPVTATSFGANWAAVSGATTYRIDVATDEGFTTFVSGWEDRPVGNVTSVSVDSGLSGQGPYYYRVRAQNVAGTSPDSNTVPVPLAPPTTIFRFVYWPPARPDVLARL